MSGYLLRYPVGQVGFTAVTFLTTLPFTQVIVVFLIAGFAITDGVGSGLVGAGSATTTGVWLVFTGEGSTATGSCC